ncbi:hypothetical protein TSOC_013332 [Tetrabaena socialis]|uniref:BTB domain-containing protein n=1 Tax=Tetrabaena socialis TaxID=47790 RepID=A0A2J7ZKN4_9CHLO|nr:hypothetical protein TSOC_013332 [Tetrabaena socialis]|eukprot:PNH00824.1 hypothetical protein TSOC_013332 [Tetrabaena socialis]
MQYPQCILPVAPGFLSGVMTRPLEGSARGQDAAVTQTLVCCGVQLRPLRGAGSHGGLELGPPLQLFAEPPAPRDRQPAAPRRHYVPDPNYDFGSPVWDPHSSAVYILQGEAVLRLGGDDTVAVVAGEVEERGYVDGSSGVARFTVTEDLASDGAGALYVADGGRIRKLQLPPGEAGAGQGSQALAAAGPSPAAAVAAGGALLGGGGAARDEVVVSTLPLQLPPGARVRSLTFDSSSTGAGRGSSLLYATNTALYHLPLGATAAAAAPVLLAGAERVRDAVDGGGPDARFAGVTGMVVDGEGAVWVLDVYDSGTAVRRVAADGTVTTVVTRVEGYCSCPAILPNGCLALCSDTLRVLYLGLKAPPSCIAAAPPPPPTGPPPRTLPGDFGALLDRQPDGTADAIIVVGDRTFHVHRAVLSARSDYFRQQPGVVGDIPVVQAQAVAELADRLLLPELCQLAVAVVEASVSAGTVVGLLLWAEACGPAFSELLSRLKAWYMEHPEAVLEEALDVVKTPT